MNFARARIILTFRIEYWKNKVKYYKLKLIEFLYQVQLDVLHKPEIEPEQVFIHTKDGEEVEVSAFYPLIYIFSSYFFMTRLSASSTPRQRPPGSSGSRTGSCWTQA